MKRISSILIFCSLFWDMSSKLVIFNVKEKWAGAKALCVNKGGFLPNAFHLQALSFPDELTERLDSVKNWIDFEPGVAAEYLKCPLGILNKGIWEIQFKSCGQRLNFLCFTFDGTKNINTTQVIPTTQSMKSVWTQSVNQDDVITTITTKPTSTQMVTSQTNQSTSKTIPTSSRKPNHKATTAMTPEVTRSVQSSTTSISNVTPESTLNKQTSTAIVDTMLTTSYTNENCPVTEFIGKSSDIAGPLVYVIVLLLLVVFLIIPLAYIILIKTKRYREQLCIDKNPFVVKDYVDIIKDCDVSENNHEKADGGILLPLNILEEILRTASQTQDQTIRLPAKTVEKILASVKNTKNHSNRGSNGRIRGSKVTLPDIRELFKVCFNEMVISKPEEKPDFDCMIKKSDPYESIFDPDSIDSGSFIDTVLGKFDLS